MNGIEVIMPRYQITGTSDPLVSDCSFSQFSTDSQSVSALGPDILQCFITTAVRGAFAVLCRRSPHKHNLCSLGSCWSPGDTPQKPVLPAPALVAVYSFLPQPQDNLFPKRQRRPSEGLEFSVPKWENQLSESSTLCTQFPVISLVSLS